jgi:hypothetical protein
MKRLFELSQQEFNTLKTFGALNKLYPNAPQTYAEVIHSFTPVANPVFNTGLTSMMDSFLSNAKPADIQTKNQILIELFKSYYGNSIIDYIKQNKL